LGDAAHPPFPHPRPSLLPASEDYNWWWRSFLTSGSSALYLFGYAIVYFVTKLDITAVTSTALYFGYMLMASWVRAWWGSRGGGRACAGERARARAAGLVAGVLWLRAPTNEHLVVRAFRPQPPFPSQVFFLLTGSIGFVATLYFVSKIFGTIKVD